MSTTTLYFPNDPLTPLDTSQRPNATSIGLLSQELYANAQSIESELGGGEHGHLGMLMPEDEYILRSVDAEPYEAPTKPTVPIYVGNATNRAQQKDDYKDEVEKYQEYRQLVSKLRQQIIQAVPKIYLAALEDPDTGLSNVTPKEMIDHLVDTCPPTSKTTSNGSQPHGTRTNQLKHSTP